jgi:hypothetical protein
MMHTEAVGGHGPRSARSPSPMIWRIPTRSTPWGGAVNQAKADYGPDRWLPQPGSTARCWYVAAYARIKARWDLTVTPQQWAAIERVWAGCGTIGS